MPASALVQEARVFVCMNGLVFVSTALGSFAALMSEGGLIGRRWSVYALAQDFLVCYVFESNDALVYALFFL